MRLFCWIPHIKFISMSVHCPFPLNLLCAIPQRTCSIRKFNWIEESIDIERETPERNLRKLSAWRYICSSLAETFTLLPVSNYLTLSKLWVLRSWYYTRSKVNRSQFERPDSIQPTIPVLDYIIKVGFLWNISQRIARCLFWRRFLLLRLLLIIVAT